MVTKKILGNAEWCSLPELGIPFIKGKLDTGAALSAVHATNIKVIQRKSGRKTVTFQVDPMPEYRRLRIKCKAELVDIKRIKSSNAGVELRFVVRTKLRIGDHVEDTLITLTNREQMGYKFLVGAKTLKGWAVVDVNQNFLAGEVSEAELKQAYHLERFAGSVAKTLNIAVLASNPGLYSNRRLLEAAKQRGHNIRFVHISQCFMKMEKDSYSLHYRGEGSMDAFDAVMPRIRPDITFYATSVLRQFAALGVYCLNSAEAIQLSRDKLLAYQILAQRGIPIPQTGFANSPDDTKQLIQLVGGAPLVIKLLQSTQGKGVILADTNKGAESAINAFKNLGANILVQEYIKESKGRDIRAFVVGKEVVAAMERVASDAEEFRSNIHLGAVGRPVMLTKEQKKIAVSAAKILGLQVAGVDLIPSDSGIKVLEVNSSPGLEGIEQATGIDVAGKIVEYLESRLAHK